MYRGNIFSSGLFAAPQTVLGAYTQSSDALNAMRQNQMKSALSQIQLNAAPTLMQQAEDQGAAKTTTMQNTANFAPLLSQLDVQQKQIANAMNNAKFQEMPQEFQAGMALKGAQLNYLKQKISTAQTAQSQPGGGRFGAAYQFKNFINSLTPAARASYIGAHPEQVNQILGGLLNNAGSSFGTATAQGMPSVTGTQQSNNPLSNMIGSLMQGQNQNAAPPAMITNPNLQQNIAPVISQQQGQQSGAQLPFAVASQIAANKGSVTSPTTKRLESAIEIEKILGNPANDELAANAAKYAGIAGKFQGGLQAWSKQNPKDYEDYLQFKNQYTSMIANIMRQVEGLGVQESTREEIRGNILKEFDSVSGNPERALDQYNRLKAQMTQLAGAASTAAQPIYPGVRERQAGINFSPKQSSQMVKMISPSGKMYNVPQGTLKEAASNGWKIANE